MNEEESDTSTASSTTTDTIPSQTYEEDGVKPTVTDEGEEDTVEEQAKSPAITPTHVAKAPRATKRPFPGKAKKHVKDGRIAKKKKRLSDMPPAKKKRHFKQDTVIRRRMKKLQNGTEFLMRRRPLERLIRDVLDGEKTDAKLAHDAIVALHTACEEELIRTFQLATMVTLTTEHDRLMQPEFRLAAKTRGTLPMTVTAEDFSAVKRNRARRAQQLAETKKLRKKQ
jgi:histone H3/H4